MRILRGVLISFALICFLIVPSVVLSANWIFYGDTKAYEAYYDKESIISPQENTLRVWDKHVYSDTGRRELIVRMRKDNIPTAGYENLFNSVSQLDLNCRTREFSTLSWTDYGPNGKTLYSSDVVKVTWKSISPDSTVERLFRELCVPRNR